MSASNLRIITLTEHAHAESSAPIRPVTVLRASLLLLVVANVGRIPLLNLGDRAAPILINDLCIAATIAAGLVAMLQARSFRVNDVALAAMVFVGIGGLTAIAAMPRFGLSAFEVVASLAYLARWVVYFAVYLVVINTVRAGDVEPVWRALEWAILVIAAFGIVQAIFLPNFAFMVYPEATVQDWDAQRHRLVSTILDPNIAAAMLVIALLVQLGRLSSGVRVPLWKPALLLVAVVFTLSRSGVLALGAGGLVVLLVRGLSKRVARLAIAMLALGVLALPKLLTFAADYAKLGVGDASAVARVVTWQRAITTFLEHPWFGIGFNTYGFVQERRGFERAGGSSYSAEGGLLFVAVLTGIVGLAVFLCMLWFVLRRCRAGWRSPAATPSERGLFVGTAAATVAILVHSLFVNTLLMPFTMEMLWVLWGTSFVAASSVRARAAITG